MSHIILSVLENMKDLEKENLTGDEKKEKLYEILKDLLGDEDFNKHKDAIDYTLETTIFLSKTYKILGINDKKCGFCF